MADSTQDSDQRDLRLDFFRGLANWAIFLDHIPNNVVAWATLRNYGFSDAADLFVFVSGYTVAFVYLRQLGRRGFVPSMMGILGRAWQIYVAHVLVFVFYVVAVGYVAQRYEHSHLLDEFNIRRMIGDPIEFIKHGLLLEFKPLNLDVLPLYVVLMASFPPLLWVLARAPDSILAASFVLYVSARYFGWNLPAYPEGSWYFNPFAWQFLFVIGAWMAVQTPDRLYRVVRSRTAFWTAIAFLGLAGVVTLASRLGVGSLMPELLMSPFTPNDKTGLAPYRIIHFLALALVVTQLVPSTSQWLKSPLVRPVIVCGQRSLEVFCAGIFLSFIAYVLIEVVSGSTLFQITVSVAGIGLMTCVAYAKTWLRTPAPH